ncbi:MAG: hypothetical protein A3G34_14375 [Candidatus Lindowbacteria bacterium RIFCSPLOWO2_12_FULL_62_27]|nr:MAG: hypothetical protein A3I06_16850 [Candidatus Lindowbacteria bacterium RIFCSPLOWO2_02_FULL_62_12]OGH62747.1 MAG: hypothetical protein A3G34_14375 [Candidatus Lindowbacteria bacterium RIFCSPLOWO2_12_FULL_62_27]
MNAAGRVRDAVILAGGQGTRIRHLIPNIPKPMVETAGRPFVESVVRLLRDQGIERIVFSTGHRAEVLETFFGDGRTWDMRIVYLRDPVPLGTGGAVRHALREVRSDRFLVLNGDSYCRFDVDSMVSVHEKTRAGVTIWLARSDRIAESGRVDIREDGTVTGFLEKPADPQAGFVNAGVYLFDRQAAETIPDGKTVSLEHDVFPNLVGRGLSAVPGPHPLLDIGTESGLQAAAAFFQHEFPLKSCTETC